MSLKKLEDLLQEYYGALPIMLGTENVRPGRLLITDWPTFWFQEPRFRGERGFAWEWIEPEQPSTGFPSRRAAGNIIYGSVEGEVTLGGSLSLPQYGLSVSGEFERKFATKIKVSEVRAEVFTNGTHFFDLKTQLHTLKENNPAKWKRVNDTFLVAEAYYVTGFTVEFMSEGGLSAEAEFQEEGQEISGKFQAKWKSHSILEMTGQPNVPIAVRGEKI